MLSVGSMQEQLSVTRERRGHAAYLRLCGEIDMVTAPTLDRWLHAAESNGNTAIMVDLEDVTFMDASGLRAFLRAADRASQSGRTFTITRAPRLVQRLLQITGATHLQTADSLAFSPGPPLLPEKR